MTKPFDERKLARHAAQTALHHLPLRPTVDDYIVSELQPEPEVPKAPPPPDLTEERRVLAGTEEELARHLPMRPLIVLWACLFVVEVIACILLMDSLGFENPARTIFGIMVSAVLFALTYVTVRFGHAVVDSTQEPRASEHDDRPAAPPSEESLKPHAEVRAEPKRRWFLAVLAVYATIVLAITVLRLEDMEQSEDGSLLYHLSAAVLLMLMTMGVAWLGELTMQRIVPLIPVARRQGLARKRIETATRAHASECVRSRDADERRKAWRATAEQMHASYANYYRVIRRAVDDARQTQGARMPTTTVATHRGNGTLEDADIVPHRALPPGGGSL